MARMKKAILFTLTVFFLGSIILTLSLIANKNNSESILRLGETASLDKIDNVFRSVERSLSGILEFYNVFYYEVKENIDNVELKLNLTIPIDNNNFNDFQSKMQSFETFIENDDSADISLNLNQIIDNELKTEILPYNTNFSINPSQQEIIIKPVSLTNINNYTIIINALSYNTASISWPTTTVGTFNIYTIINYATGQLTNLNRIDPTLLNSALIQLDVDTINLNINNPAILSIDNNLVNNADLTAIINFNKLEEVLTINYPNHALNVSLFEFDTARVDYTRL